ncbi:MAG: hypothetical protein A2W80_18090 [Candidatus Riflebacteria bacterium GWC2_50_8]|nr:MAG: hypothetical protein A2W80_18090 [Candidatus Riflebacteria bacterium GWC2_50_8]
MHLQPVGRSWIELHDPPPVKDILIFIHSLIFWHKAKVKVFLPGESFVTIEFGNLFFVRAHMQAIGTNTFTCAFASLFTNKAEL